MTPIYSVHFDKYRKQWCVQTDYGHGFIMRVFWCNEKKNAEKVMIHIFDKPKERQP